MKHNRNSLTEAIRFALGAGLVASLAMTAAPVWAQDADEEEEALTEDRIVVTGTRIERANLTSATQVNSFNSEQIELSGAVNTAELLRTLPAMGVSGLTSTNSNFFVGSSGLNSVELRNLGEDRTLVLVNGRRFVAGVPGSATVDFNSIPTEMIERIDVVTGGASAIYGSDALAGVVNIILKDEFEGAILSAQAGISDEGDDETLRASATVGSTFADGRGSAIASLTVSREDGVFARDRDGRDIDGFSNAFFGPALGFEWQESVFPFYSSFSERGRIIVPGVGNRVFDERTGEVRPFVSANPDGTPLDGFNRQAFRAIAVPTERFLFSSLLNYEVSEKMNFFFEGTYASTETQSELEPFPLSSEDLFGGNAQQFVDDDGDGIFDRSAFGISILNPFVPEGIRAAARIGADFDDDGVQDIADEDLVVGFVRRTTELDQRGAFNTRQTARFVFGVDGEINDNWSYETSVNMGRTTQMQRSTGQVNVLNMRYALDAVQQADGSIVCADEIARLQGCVPVNVFGVGSITPEAANYLRAPSSTQATIEQQVYQGFVTGDLGFGSPGAEENIRVVFGGEYRVEDSESIPDALSQVGLNAGNISPPVIGDFNVAEVFAELDIPLVQNRPFVQDLRMNLSARWSDYSTVGNTFAWAANAQYAPSDLVRFRAQYAQAVRAPNIGELFQPLSETFEGGSDPCNGLTLADGSPAFLNDNGDPNSGVDASTVGSATAQACIADPLVAARVNRDGAVVLSQSELQGVGGFNGGNPNLDEETANTFTLGAVVTPDTGNRWIDNLNFSIDYYNIEIEDAISAIGRQTSLNQCYVESGGVFDSTSPFCSNIVRFASGPFLGALNELNAVSQNLANIEVAGIDVQASYSLGLNDLITNTTADLGRFDFSLTYGYLDKYEQEAFPGADVIDFSGAYGLFDHEVLFATVYNRGDLTIAYDVNWLPESRLGSTGLDIDRKVPEVFIQDIQARYALDGGLELVLGVDNVTDEFVRFGGGFDATGTYTDGAVYDAIGRRYYAGLRKVF
jgi:outer membrane receptor protein involved in Fe transport